MFLNPDRVELPDIPIPTARSQSQTIAAATHASSAISRTLLVVASLVQHWQLWFASIFLVSIPVFIEAPLVRYAPWLSLICTVGWLSIAKNWQSDRKLKLWGSLIWGFSLTWLCGSIYWGWLRWEPAYHVPVEALALPWAIWGIRQDSYRVGGWFYIGSLVGTAITDLYFYIAKLFPSWQALMQVETNISLAQPILKTALTLVETPWGMTWACILAAVLLVTGNRAMRSANLCYWAFSGAVLGTIFVDLLFFITAKLG